jgi:hypothetical protein
MPETGEKCNSMFSRGKVIEKPEAQAKDSTKTGYAILGRFIGSIPDLSVNACYTAILQKRCFFCP